MRKDSLLRNGPFVFGVVFLLLLSLSSYFYSFYSLEVHPDKMLYDKNGNVMALAPFAPSLNFPLGSDLDGNSFVFKLIEGAKYTIGLSLIVAFFRVVFSCMFGYLLYRMPFSLRNLFGGLSNVFHYAPVTIFTYILIAPVILTFSWSYDVSTKIIFPMLILIGISIPVLALYVQNELDSISTNEFIDSAKVLGGSRFHLLRKHLAPFMYPKLLLLFVQQVGQVLIIFAHLGLLNVFIGGTDVRVMDVDFKTGETTTESFSMTNEWAGLIAQNFQYAQSFPWMVLAPVSAFALSILAINSIVYGLTNRKTVKKGVGKKSLPEKTAILKQTHFELNGAGHSSKQG
ncbi:ABC transporter permease subunit [Bacillus sp. es.036]|uniref:ABC transporter permease subunit n=1 Tax=Bacillus sp. es.036 TaxID=1761764 RepID=UPI000C012AE7|nr:ABC transporter permease subunit [Bacillus sp. es.036]PFG13237.1 peptide/nickel transport system permease protein [Bacillus sp. es.036]